MRASLGATIAVIGALLVAPSASAQVGQGEEAGEPEVVRVGVLVNDIQQLELPTHSYSVDMYMWFRWDDPELDPSKSFEFMNAFELWGHILTRTYNKPQRLPDGSYYQLIRNQGKFNAKLPLEKYPFDTQHLLVEVEDSVSNADNLVFVPTRTRSPSPTGSPCRAGTSASRSCG